MSALFKNDGTLEESETGMPVSELPAVVHAYMKAHYADTPIREAARITIASGAIQYEAAVKGKDIIFDSNGNFIKEVKD